MYRSHKTVITFLTLILLILPISVRADESEHRRDSRFSLGIQEWISWADAGWQTSFPYNGISGTGVVESELNFNSIDSPMTILTGSALLSADWSLAAAYGFGDIRGGRGTDTDRFFPITGGVNVFSESRQEISGDVKLWGIDFTYQKAYQNDTRSPWGLILGFFHYEDKLRITNGYQTVSGSFDGITFPPVGTVFTGLDSTFDFSWNALKIGVLREAPITARLSYLGTVSIYPYLDYEGEGYWNLRAGTGPNDFRLQSPNFVQNADSGYGVDASLELVYMITKTAALSAGYRYLQLKANSGRSTIFFADGSLGTTNLDWAEIKRQGIYVGLLIRF